MSFIQMFPQTSAALPRSPLPPPHGEGAKLLNICIKQKAPMSIPVRDANELMASQPCSPRNFKMLWNF